MALEIINKTTQQEAYGELVTRAARYAETATAANTRRAYSVALARFIAWCDANGVSATPATPETVAAYITEMADTHSPAIIDQHLAAISTAHRLAGHNSPTTAQIVKLTRKGLRIEKGTAQRQARPISVPELEAILAPLTDSPIDARDRALILIGFAGGMRRSELVALDVADLEETPEGLRVTIRRSKTDQEAAGRVIGIPYGQNLATCPVRALSAWLRAAGITEGPVFRSINRHAQISDSRLSAQSVALVVKARAEAAGIDPAKLSGHSLRAGLATAAARAGVDERTIARTTGHTGTTVLRRYIRDGELFTHNAAASIGL